VADQVTCDSVAGAAPLQMSNGPTAAFFDVLVLAGVQLGKATGRSDWSSGWPSTIRTSRASASSASISPTWDGRGATSPVKAIRSAADRCRGGGDSSLTSFGKPAHQRARHRGSKLFCFSSDCVSRPGAPAGV
jgi:hypothetical protein